MRKDALLSQARLAYEINEVADIEHAIDFATAAHKGQKRKSGEAYITHPLSVAAILIDWGMDIDTIVAGILHDTVEGFPRYLIIIYHFYSTPNALNTASSALL